MRRLLPAHVAGGRLACAYDAITFPFHPLFALAKGLPLVAVLRIAASQPPDVMDAERKAACSLAGR